MRTSGIILVTGMLAFSSSSYAFAPDHKAHVEANIDKHRVVYVDASLAKNGSIHAHIKLSNGWRMDPWWVSVTVKFMVNGHEAKKFVMSAKCPASLGGHAHECNYDRDLPNTVWDETTSLAVEGHKWNGNGNERGPPSIPIWSSTF